MAVTVTTVVKRRRDTEANWIANNPTLESGEQAFSTDKKDFKFGPGVWNSLPYWIAGGGGKVAIPVTNPSSSFTYNSGITGTIPPTSSIYIKRGTVYQKYADPFWDGATGIMTTDVDAAADSYVLVVG